MRNLPILYALILGMLTAASAAAGAQSCTPVDSTLAMPLVDLKDLVASTDAVDANDRQQLGIPAVDSSTVSVVSDTKICDKVLAAFKPTLDASIAVPTKLFVMKVGTVYVALYPLVGSSQADIYRVVSKQYAIISKFAK